MELIRSGETLDFLSKSAPRAWVKRMLLWMIFNNDLSPYFVEGRVVAKERIFSILVKALGADAFGDKRNDLIREHFDPEIAEKYIASDPVNEYQEDVACEWNSTAEPQEVSCGYFVFATSINWDEGIVHANLDSKNSEDETLFWDAETLLASDLSDPDYEVTLKGLCFDRNKIEILQPHIELPQSAKHRRDDHPPRIGRPRTWNWDGAMTYLLTVAQKPDGLPTGPGAQAQIEHLITDWFMDSTGNSPAVSQVRQHAAKIMKALKKPENQ